MGKKMEKGNKTDIESDGLKVETAWETIFLPCSRPAS